MEILRVNESRIRAMAAHFMRSVTIESNFLQEEEMNFRPDEDQYFVCNTSLWHRAVSNLPNDSCKLFQQLTNT